MYRGDFYNDQKHGQGELKMSSGDVYRGGWNAGRKNGKGIYNFANSVQFYLRFLGYL